MFEEWPIVEEALMSVAPDLPPVVRIPSRVTRGGRAAAPRRLQLVLPAVRPTLPVGKLNFHGRMAIYGLESLPVAW